LGAIIGEGALQNKGETPAVRRGGLRVLCS
jgi:hypothetical protein